MKKVISCLFVALMTALVMVSCTSKKNLDVLEGEWGVVVVGDMAVPDSVDAFLSFNVAEQTLSGYAGCNYLTGTLHDIVDVPKPLFSAIGSTRKWCPDMTIEDALLPALSHVVDFSIENDTLFLLDATGASVVALVRN